MADRPGGTQSADEAQLHSLGYAQELRRGMKTFSNFAVSFTIISILSGCLTLFYFAMNTGGPAIMTLGWLFVGFFVLMVALGMAEVASSYPTAGGLYYWAAKLADEAGGNGAAWSWFVGWFNLVGQVAVTAGIDFGLAFFINTFLTIQFGFPSDPPHTILIYAIVLFIHGLLNTFGIRIVAILNNVSVWWHLVGVARDRPRLHGLQPAHPDRLGHGLHDRGQQHERRSEPVVPWIPDLRNPAVRRLDRLAQRPIHAHRIRRLGPHVRGNPRRQPVGSERDRLLGDHLDHRRLRPPRGDERRDHSRCRLQGRDRGGSCGLSARAQCRGQLRDCRAAGPDLDRCDRPDWWPDHPADRDRGPVLLRHVVGHGQLPDDLRLLAGRSGPWQSFLAPDQQADPDTHELDLAGCGRRVHPRTALSLQPRRLRGRHLDRGDRPVRGLRLPGLPAPASRQRSSRKDPGHSAAGASQSGSSPRSGSSSSSSCSCSPRFCQFSRMAASFWPT